MGVAVRSQASSNSTTWHSLGGSASVIANLELSALLAECVDEWLTTRDLVAGYAAYERDLAAWNLLEFDGRVVQTGDLLSGDVDDRLADRWDYVFCDEF